MSTASPLPATIPNSITSTCWPRKSAGCDHLRWQQNPFVIGIEIKVSQTNHGVPDICDTLQGRYPKDFKWTGWHPFCRCFATAITASEKERDKYWDAMANDEDVSNWEFKGTIKEMPENFTGWIDANEERIAKAKSMPYFIRDNFKDGNVAKGLRWEADAHAAEERMMKAVEFINKQGELDSKEYWPLQDNWDALTDEERLLALERAKVTGVVDMESLDMSPTILQRVSKKEILDFIDEDLENMMQFGERSVEDSLHYIVARDDRKVEFIDNYWEGGRKLPDRRSIKWACTNQGMPSYGECYWVRDREAMQEMLEFINGAQYEEGRLIAASKTTGEDIRHISEMGGKTTGNYIKGSFTNDGIDSCIKKLRNLGSNAAYEEAFIELADGRTYHKTSNVLSIHFDEEEKKLIRGGKLYHNHPSNVLSPDDVIFAANHRLSSIAAVRENDICEFILDNVQFDNVAYTDVYEEVVAKAWEKVCSLGDSRLIDKYRRNAIEEEIKAFAAAIGATYRKRRIQ